MNITILGVGKIGENMVKKFVGDGVDVVVIDNDGEQVENIVNHYDVKGVVGNGLDKNTMSEASIDSCDIFVACAFSDEVNILSCILAKKMGAKHTVARVRDPELFSEVDMMQNEFGLSLAFNPEYRTAVAISQILKFPSANSVESFANGKAIMASFTIEKDNELKDKSLIEIASYGYKLLFTIVVRGEQTILPRGDFVLREDDEVYIIAKETELVAFCKKIKIFKPRAKSVFIVGGGKIAYYLTKILNNSGTLVKIMEKDEQKAENLSNLLPKASVFCGDGADQEVLAEENMRNTDAFVALTGNDETNVIISLYATTKNLPKVITKVNKEPVVNMVKNLGLDTVVSPKEVIANHIIKFVRTCKTHGNEKIDSLYRLHDNVEAIEFTVSLDNELVGVKLKDLKVKKDILIGGIVRDGEYILPSGDSEFCAGDKVIVVASLNTIAELADIVR